MTDDAKNKLFHNLKNDLASMTALLNLHKMYKDSINTEEMLNRLFERQTVIATAYEKLYQEGDYPNVSLLLFTNELLAREDRTLKTYNSYVQVLNFTDDIKLPIKQITAFGQILVELVTNSYRHAFSNTAQPEIEFHIRENDGVIQFEYKDNGCGFDSEFLPLKSRTLGMQFIAALSKQLGGKPSLTNRTSEGIEFSMEFSVNN